MQECCGVGASKCRVEPARPSELGLPTDVVEVRQQYGTTRLVARAGVVPRKVAVIEAEIRARQSDETEDVTEQFSLASLRSAAAELGVKWMDLANAIRNHLSLDLGKAATSAPSVDRSAPAAPSSRPVPDKMMLGEVTEDDTDGLIQEVIDQLRKVDFDVVSAISSDEGTNINGGPCLFYTGFYSFEELQAQFSYLNAAGAFDRLRMYRSDVDQDGASGPLGRGGRARALPKAIDQYIFWLVVFRRFREPGMLEHAADLFRVSQKTAARYYDTWTIAVGRFFRGQFHPATRAQARDAASAHAMAALGLDAEMCAYIGDCTERGVFDPGDGALHSALFSQYKGRTTIKYLFISTLDSYISYAPKPANGACTDNGLHIIAGVPDIL